MAEDKVNARIILALETAPRPEIPADFAARVARKLPPQGALTVTPARYGQIAALACLVMLPMLMFAFAHQAAGTSFYWVCIEWIFSAQSVLLAGWLAMRGKVTHGL